MCFLHLLQYFIFSEKVSKICSIFKFCIYRFENSIKSRIIRPHEKTEMLRNLRQRLFCNFNVYRRRNECDATSSPVALVDWQKAENLEFCLLGTTNLSALLVEMCSQGEELSPR